MKQTDKVVEMIQAYLERKQQERAKYLQKPERYRNEGELEKIEASLITLECLAMECGLITEGTV